LATRAKVRLSANECKIIKAAIDNCTAIPVDARKEVLQGYHCALHRQARQLAKERSEIRKRRESVSTASKAMHEACSNASHTNSRRHSRHGSRVKNLEHLDRRKSLKEPRLIFLISQWARQHHAKDTRSSSGSSTGISIHYAAKPRGPKWTYASSNIARAKVSRKQVDSQRRGIVSQWRYTQTHAVTIVLGTEAWVNDLGHRHQNTTTTQGTSEPKDPSLPRRCTTMKMTKRRWELHALLAEFTSLPYAKDWNYPMINKNMTDLRSHSHGSQIIYKQSEY
jgi:hypothetical protein